MMRKDSDIDQILPFAGPRFTVFVGEAVGALLEARILN